MSSFKQVLRRTYATRKKTVKRRVDAERRAVAALGDDGEACQQSETPGAGAPAFIAADSIGASMPGFVFKAGPRGLGYYRDDGACGESAAAAEGDVGLGWAVRERVTITADGEEGMEGAIAAYKRVRARDGRQKARVVVVVGDSDKPLARLPPRCRPPPLLLPCPHSLTLKLFATERKQLPGKIVRRLVLEWRESE